MKNPNLFAKSANISCIIFQRGGRIYFCNRPFILTEQDIDTRKEDIPSNSRIGSKGPVAFSGF